MDWASSEISVAVSFTSRIYHSKTVIFRRNLIVGTPYAIALLIPTERHHRVGDIKCYLQNLPPGDGQPFSEEPYSLLTIRLPAARLQTRRRPSADWQW